jgi:hypothetical protein
MLITVQPSFCAVQRLGEGARLGVGQTLRRSAGILTLRIVVERASPVGPRRRPSCTLASAVIGQVTESSAGSATYHEVNAYAQGAQNDYPSTRDAMRSASGVRSA